MPLLNPEYKSFYEETDRLLSLLSSMPNVLPQHRKLLAEIIHLRLAILLENHMKIIFSKLCCGARYADGSRPALLVPQRSAAAAIFAMQTLNRTKPVKLIWNDGRKIRDGVKHILDPSDHSISILLNFGSHFTEVRYIRNHIAHKNEGTRVNFRKLIQQYYGANVRGITSGVMLLSDRVSKPPLVEVHIRKSRTLIKQILKA